MATVNASLAAFQAKSRKALGISDEILTAKFGIEYNQMARGDHIHYVEVKNEIPTGNMDGSNRLFILKNIPIQNSLSVYDTGIRLRPDWDYTLNNNQITLEYTPELNSWILVDYKY
jgi:hypothetical protein